MAISTKDNEPLPVFSAQNRNSGIRSAPSGVSTKSASVLRETWSGDRRDKDPSASVPGMPPNFGEPLMPHVLSFQGIVSSVSRVYRPSDEALKESFENARMMRNDIVIMECIEQRQRSQALLDWHLEPDDSKDSKQIALCEDLKSLIEQIPRFMQYRENLAHAVWYGRYGVQQRFRWKKIRGKMRVIVDRWLPVNGDKIVFRYDDGTQEYDPDQVGIRVGAGFTTGDTVAKRWSVERINKVEPTDYGLAYFLEHWERPMLAIHKHMIEDGEYEEPQNAGRVHGLGVRSRIFWSWYQKQETLAWIMEYLERSALGIEIWYYPWGNPEAEAKMRTAATERLGQGRNIILVPKPLGEESSSYGVERIEPGMAGADTMIQLVQEYFGHLIKRYILGQTLTTESSNTGLGSNLGEIHMDTYLQIIRYDATNLEETLTTDLVDPLKIYNFPKYQDIPVKFKIDTEVADPEAKLAAWKQAFEMGLELDAQEVMDMIGASKPDLGADTLSLEKLHRMQAEANQPAGPGGDGASLFGPMAGKGFSDEVYSNLQQQRIIASMQKQGPLPSNGNGEPFQADAPPSENSDRIPVEIYAAFDESMHPRASDGRFGDKAGKTQNNGTSRFPAENFIRDKLGAKAEPGQVPSSELGESVNFIFGDTTVQTTMKETASEMFLVSIGTKKTDDLSKIVSGTGRGMEVINAIKEYSDHSGKKLIVPEATEPAMPFWEGIKWLTRDYDVSVDWFGGSYKTKNTFSYTPSGAEPEKYSKRFEQSQLTALLNRSLNAEA